MQTGNSLNDARHRFGGSLFRIAAVVMLLSFAAVWESLQLSSLENQEIWSHLRIGSWILQNKSWPEVGLFSTAANHPWRDLHWGYDALVAAGYRILGLRVIPGLMMCFRLALAVLTFFLAGGRRKLWSAVALSAVAQYVLAYLGPDSASMSVLFFGITLLLLLTARRSGKQRVLFVLPVMFLVWANLDIGFIYGTALYLLFLTALLFVQVSVVRKGQLPEQLSRKIPVRTAALVGAGSLLATLVNPYSYYAYGAFFADQNNAANSYLPDYNAMRFHQPQDYLLLLLAMATLCVLGMRRTRDPFSIGVLLGCLILAFYAQRDTWLVTLAAVAFIGDSITQASSTAVPEKVGLSRSQEIRAVFAAVVIAVVAFAVFVPRDHKTLLAKIAKHYPVRASEYIRQHHLPAPLFNSYAWGGFLTWYLPEYSVAIDGRRGLYPQDEEVDYFKVMKADIPYQLYPPMSLARTLLLNKTEVMAEALRTLPGFQVAYEDDISVVLLQERQNDGRGL